MARTQYIFIDFENVNESDLSRVSGKDVRVFMIIGTRHTSLAEIPALRTPEERLALLKAELADATQNRPSTRKTLENRVKSAFENKAEPDFVEKTISTFVQSGILSFTETDKVSYKAA